jgi:hypothetical protein
MLRSAWRSAGNGAQGRDRTTDTVIFSHVLYQLSYLGAETRRTAGKNEAGGVIEAQCGTVQNGRSRRDTMIFSGARAQPRPSSGALLPRVPSSSSSSLPATT